MIIGGWYQGEQAKKLGEKAARGYQEAGRRRMAAATREADELQRNKEATYSRAIAVAAASGGGVDTPGLVRTIGNLNAQLEYNVFAALYNGADEYEGMLFQADQAIREGQAAATASMIQGVTSAVSFGYGAGMFGGSTPVPTGAAGSPAGAQMSLVPNYQNVGKLVQTGPGARTTVIPGRT